MDACSRSGLWEAAGEEAGLKVALSQRRTRESMAAVSQLRPSGLACTAVTRPSCATAALLRRSLGSALSATLLFLARSQRHEQQHNWEPCRAGIPHSYLNSGSARQAKYYNILLQWQGLYSFGINLVAC